jgi:hypothetical protein
MLETVKVQCPYCAEMIEILLDCSVAEQTYIEDCQVCCCPITFEVSEDHDGQASVCANREND